MNNVIDHQLWYAAWSVIWVWLAGQGWLFYHSSSMHSNETITAIHVFVPAPDFLSIPSLDPSQQPHTSSMLI